jgi:hypothetical protein
MSEFENWTDEEIARIQTGTMLTRPSDHQSLFKYIGLNSKASWDLLRRTLKKCELVGGSPSNMNDPFELSPVIFDDLQPARIADAVRYNPLMDNLTGKPKRSIDQIFADTEQYRRQARSFFEETIAHYRLIAFCERSDSGLLWAHYANSYQGACL